MPTELEIKALIYACLAGLCFFGGWHVKGSLDVGHAAELKVAQDQVTQAQQEKNNTILQAQQSANATAEANWNEQLNKANSTSSALNALVLRYEAQLRSGGLSQIPSSTSGPNGAAAFSAGVSDLNAATTNAIGACTDDSAQLEALESWITQQQGINQ